MAHELTALLNAPAGGVWTDEVGVVTGELELRTTCQDDGQVAVSVRYAGAQEWYAVRGATARLRDPADAEVLHDVLRAVLDRS